MIANDSIPIIPMWPEVSFDHGLLRVCKVARLQERGTDDADPVLAQGWSARTSLEPAVGQCHMVGRY